MKRVLLSGVLALALSGSMLMAAAGGQGKWDSSANANGAKVVSAVTSGVAGGARFTRVAQLSFYFGNPYYPAYPYPPYVYGSPYGPFIYPPFFGAGVPGFYGYRPYGGFGFTFGLPFYSGFSYYGGHSHGVYGNYWGGHGQRFAPYGRGLYGHPGHDGFSHGGGRHR